jgi:hypothetical protein
MMAIRRIFFLLCGGLMPALLWAGPPESDFLYIQYMERHKETNGQDCLTFKLVCADNIVDAVKVYYQENGLPALYQAGVKDACFTISADRPSRIQVFAVARAPRKILLARTDTVLFGRSGTPPERLTADQAAKKMLSVCPRIELISPVNYYWNQTGQNFLFYIKRLFDVNRHHLSVLENGRVHRLLSNPESEFVYVPPHDRNLRNAGPHAYRNDILFARLFDRTFEVNLTYSLMLHRSRHAFDNHAAGAIVFVSSLISFAGLVVAKRKTPWWKTSD